ETYGKYVPRPYPALIEAETGIRMVNLGCVNAGMDVYLNEPAVTEIAAAADVVVIQIVGAQNLTNRFYAVHPRRNDRFLGATPLLRSIFREVDFTEFNFTKHMLMTLQATAPDRFEVLVQDLRAAWLTRMQQLLSRLPTKVVLLWMAGHAPAPANRKARLDRDPMLVDAAMVGAVRPLTAAYVEAISTPDARAMGTEGMAFGPLDALAAMELPGPAVHEEVAQALRPVLERLL
ncbi:MAG: DUF6473 family protein, partial [Paracoccaceae bacterium]